MSTSSQLNMSIYGTLIFTGATKHKLTVVTDTEKKWQSISTYNHVTKIARSEFVTIADVNYTNIITINIIYNYTDENYSYSYM